MSVTVTTSPTASYCVTVAVTTSRTASISTSPTASCCVTVAVTTSLTASSSVSQCYISYSQLLCQNSGTAAVHSQSALVGQLYAITPSLDLRSTRLLLLLLALSQQPQLQPAQQPAALSKLLLLLALQPATTVATSPTASCSFKAAFATSPTASSRCCY